MPTKAATFTEDERIVIDCIRRCKMSSYTAQKWEIAQRCHLTRERIGEVLLALKKRKVVKSYTSYSLTERGEWLANEPKE